MALGRVVNSFAAPASTPAGLAWDGQALWVSDQGTNRIYRVRPDTGVVTHDFAAPAMSPRGLAWDGRTLWNCDNVADRIYQISPSTGNVIGSIASPAGTPVGLTWDGKHLWNSDPGASLIFRVDPITGSISRSFATPGVGTSGLTWDGKHLWNDDSGADRVYQIDPVTGAVLCSYPTPGPAPRGLAWNGQYLWLTDINTDLIYQIEVTPSVIASAIRALGPIGQWGLWEAGGAVAYDISGNSPAGERNGQHVGITHHDAPGPGDGSMAPYYDAVNDYTSIWSAGLSAAFNGAEGAAVIYGKVLNVGVWTDGASRRLLTLFVDGNNRVLLQRGAGNNQLVYQYTAGAVTELIVLPGLANVEWFSVGISWSAAADEMRAYYNGLQAGATQTVLGVWVGNLNVTRTLIGALTQVPANVYNGWLAQGAIFDRPLTPAEFAGLPRGGP